MQNEYTSEQLMDLIDYSPNGILSKVIVKNENTNITLFCMAKGTEMTEHTTTKQASVQVVEGNGIFNLEGKDIPMTPGRFIYMQENVRHALKATENTSFILTLVMPK